MENLKYWDALKQPPLEALKTIQGGRLKGKTDISPQWRYKAMTEQFGVCGVGWKYTVDKLWLEPAGDEICAFAEIGLSIKVDSEWSAPIPGIGGSMLREQETKGLYVSDECYKMAITDALSVAMKMIGVAADIYAGLFDGSKYTTERKPAQRTSQKDEPPDTRNHWCKQHNTEYYMKGKMTSFGHKIEGTEEWCHERSEKTSEKETPPPGSKEAPPPLKNLGELYTRAGKYGLSPRDVCQANGVGAGEEIKDLDVAWKTIVNSPTYGATIKAAQAKANKE